MAKSIVFIDTEVGVDDHKIHDIGAVRQDRAYFHSASVRNFVEFIAGAEYICGHNILHHDLKYIHDSLGYELRVTVIKYLRGTPCANGCTYCHNALDIHRELKRIFGYDSFRTYNGEPLQEKAAQAAVDGKSVLAVFPTGGGSTRAG